MKVEPEILDHPKFLRLKKAVGDIALEVLVRLWGHCEANQRGEYWRGADCEYVEIVARWNGQAGVLFGFLTAIGWVDAEEKGVRIHDWNDTNWRAVSNWKLGQRPKKNYHDKPTQKPRLMPPPQTGSSTGGSPLNEGMNEGMNEGVGATEIPSEQTVLAHAESYPGDPVRGIPQSIPEGWVLDWFAWRMSPKAGPWPADWRADMERRYRAAWINGDRRTRGSEKNAAVSPTVVAVAEGKAKSAAQRELNELSEEINSLRQAGAPIPPEKIAREKELQALV